MHTILDATYRNELLGRLRRLDPDRPARWGRLTARQVPTHLLDQMRLTLGELPVGDFRVTGFRGLVRYPPLRQVALYWLPWPKGIPGPPAAFTTSPSDFAADLDELEAAVERFVRRGTGGSWPDHPAFGRLSGRDWGIFCYRHFDHHLKQFGS